MNDTVSATGPSTILTILIAGLTIIGFAAGMALITSIMASSDVMAAPVTIKISASFLITGFIATVLAITSLSRVTVWNVTAQILPLWFSITILILMILLVFRLDYSTVFIGLSWPLGLVLLFILGRVLSLRANFTIGVLPSVDQDIITGHHTVVLDDKTILDDLKTGPDKIGLVLATRDNMKDPTYAGMLSVLAGRRIPVMPAQTYYEQISGRVDHRHVDAAELMQLRPYRRYMALKRMSDIIMASVGLLVFLPVMLVVGILIKFESSGPVIFIQRRVGEGGREFNMFKFRSMVQDAEKSGAKFATTGDARITRLGRIIRKLRIDELPQLVNVLLGSMSMIGPRPEQKAFVDDLEQEIPLYPIRHAVRPGITGWAQVMQGYADDVSSTDVKLSYDLFYIKNLSLMMDMVIFFKTIKTIITGFGAR